MPTTPNAHTPIKGVTYEIYAPITGVIYAERKTLADARAASRRYPGSLVRMIDHRAALAAAQPAQGA